MDKTEQFVPFPDCSENCEAVKYFGVGECENICPSRFDEAGEPVKCNPSQKS